MKNMKKFAGIMLLAMALILSMVTPAFAADIIISGGAGGSEYAAYRLLNATDGGEGKFAYTVNEKYESILKTVTGENNRAEIVGHISALDASGIRGFADDVYAAILAADPAVVADYTTVEDKFSGVEQGYYLIAETKVGDSSDTFSLVMLDTAGQESITVFTKEDKPAVEKKVEEINDTTGEASWGDSADYDIGDVINYRITGTVSSKYADYASYYYNFVDTMDKGLTYNEDAKVFVDNGGNRVEVTGQFTIEVTKNGESNLANGFSATANLKELTGVEITADTKIVVEYTSTLNEYAVSGVLGNKNEVFLEYENDPYHVGDGNPETPDRPGEPGESGEPGKTTIDTNIVFTFDAVVNKVDSEGNPLTGAGFTLYKWVKDGVVNEDQTTSDGWVAVGEEIKGDGMTEFTFKGLDVGKYKLVETTVPGGYNKCDDIEFEIVAEYDFTTDPPTLTGLLVKNAAGDVISDGAGATFSAVVSSGEVSTEVVNLSGTELPGTGGIGKTIFYVAGSVLVLSAVVLLIAKKRVKSED